MTTTTMTTDKPSLPAATAAESKKGTVDYEAFLKLLTAQLRNQDPLAPMDATQFMNQLAQMSTVEQAVKTNDTLGQVLETLKNSGMRMDMAYLGRTVEASSDALALSGGKAQTAYAVEGAAATVTIDVLDDAGRTRYSTGGSPQAGRQVFAWDGRQTGGGTAPDGVYHVRVTAKDKDGNAVNVATVTSDTVKEVRTVDGATQLVLKGGAIVPAKDVLSAS
ncbi:flagellar hook assembly protein FlgD [Azospirillum sp. TSO22-1]|uniref:flagellar hook assembly protein FlgD n=1 Tax=Azospirillum sp. TSO22-1 TaxID=716789 RepID=UPI000D607A4F|nr:flagellar hook assembly protein FlgD [Azospirillum sp. TSO22-1]PWC42567.1 flagellar biosynthesis protein FlgD [Azospirillum sp. TSO22-1]